MARTIFREEAVDRLRSPDEIDQLLRVVNRRSWVPVAIVGILLGLAVLWSIVGRVPETVEGQGVLIVPHTVVPFQAEADGQVTEWLKKPGDPVEEGERIATLAQPETERARDRARDRLDQAREHETKLEAIRKVWVKEELDAIEARREGILSQIKGVDAQIALIDRGAKEYVAKHETQLATESRQLAEAITKSLELEGEIGKRLDRYQKMRATAAQEGKNTAVSEDDVSDIRRDLASAQIGTAQLRLKQRTIALARLQLMNHVLTQSRRKLDFQSQRTGFEVDLRAIGTAKLEVERQQREWTFNKESRLRELKARYDELVAQIEEHQDVEAVTDGRLLETTVTARTRVKAGDRLGLIDELGVEGAGGSEIVLAYFVVRDGKRIHKGQAVQVAPATIKREQHGSIEGTVVSVVQRQVTPQAVAAKVGSSELAAALTAGGRFFEVKIALTPSGSGFKWTSDRPPERPVTAGTTATVRVSLKDVAPIDLVVPALRDAFGL